MVNEFASSELDQGFFTFPRPSLKQMVGYVLVISLLFSAYGWYAAGLEIPDIPQLSEANTIDSLDDLNNSMYGPLQAGYGPEYADKAAFVIVPLRMNQGSIATFVCSVQYDSEGDESWALDIEIHGTHGLEFEDANGNKITASFDRTEILDPVGDFFNPACGDSSGVYIRDLEGQGVDQKEDNPFFATFMMVESEPMRYQLLSVQEVYNFQHSLSPGEVTQREDMGRWSLLFFGMSGLVFMYSTSPPLVHELKKIRKSNRKKAKDIDSSIGVLGFDGRYLQHVGADGTVIGPAKYPIRSYKDDWLFGCPPLPTSYTNFFAADPEGQLIHEHPHRIGEPKAATITPYSFGALVFALSFIWLASDLRARDGSDFHTLLGWGLTAFVTFVNLIWFRSAYKQMKMSETIKDLPTSPIRSVAVGQAEIVGQARPARHGTPEIKVGGKSLQGLLAWSWREYEYQCSTDDEGNTSCSWVQVNAKQGGTPFIVHDGTGGILIHPEKWTKKGTRFDYGNTVATWKRGDHKWELETIGTGDPVYVLGDCVPRSHEDLEQNGSDETLANALVTMVPSVDTGEASTLHYGTEVDVLATRRSSFETLIVPLLVFTFGIVMFLQYKP